MPLLAQSRRPVAAEPGTLPGQRETAGASLNRRLDIDVRSVTLEMAVQEIRRKSGVDISHSKDVFQPEQRVTLQATQITVADALERILKGTDVVVQTSPSGMIYLARKSQQREAAKDSSAAITGRVIDSATGDPVFGVNIVVVGTKLSAVTDGKGEFTIADVPVGTHTVTFRLLGYTSVTRTVEVKSDQRTVVRVQLRASANLLSGVITTATGAQRRLEVGNDLTTLNVDSIMKTAPITSVTDLLESRVPGMSIQRTSGTPGDPARIRLRGASSIYANNDPILIVDGIRMYSEQSEERNINKSGEGRQYATPSPIDQIDPNVIETIEILKGPSASALYGSDAANGVIVITTKRGRSGPSQWALSMQTGRSGLPVSRWPESTYIWATRHIGGSPILCPSIDLCDNAQIDSIVRFQALNDPRLTALGTGSSFGGSVSVSGGIQSIQWSLTGSGSQVRGLLKLPDIDAERYARFQGESVPGWMRRPDHLEQRNGNASMQIQVSPRVTLGLQSTLNQQIQHRTSMSSSFGSAINTLQKSWVDRSQLGYKPLLGNPYEQVRSGNINLVNSIRIGANTWEWLPITATVGMNTLTQNNEMSIAKGLLTGTESGGAWRGSTRVASGITGAVNTTNIPVIRYITLAAGLTFDRGQTNDQSGALFGIPKDVSDPSVGEDTLRNQFQRSTTDRRSFGWFLEPKLNMNSRFFMMPGFRLDNNGLAGRNARLNLLPKMNLSWIASEESFFPLRHVVNQLRLRTAFGVSGVQPRLADAARLYQRVEQNPLNGTEPLYGDLLQLSRIGNTRLRPERGVEIEGGFDAEIWNNRLGIRFTQYHKRRIDAIMDNDVALSVAGGGKQKMNIGDIVNSGTEIDLQAQLVERRSIGINTGINFTRYRSKVTRLTEAGLVRLAGQFDAAPYNRQIFVEGYPLESVWSRPVLGYADINGNGRLEKEEVVIGTQDIYAGSYEPRYEAALHPGVTLLNGRINFAAAFSFVGGRTQEIGFPQELSAGVSESGVSPNTGIKDDAKLLTEAIRMTSDCTVVGLRCTWYGLLQEVSVIRFQSISMQFNLGRNFVSKMRARSASISLQGSNVHLWTNYRGIDPNVNSVLGGRGSMDDGQLPQSRTWSLMMRLGI